LRQLAADAGLREPPAGCDEAAVADWINAQGGRLRVVGPASKRLACGDEGVGAMADVVAAV
jgi:phosphopantothenoylcysteine decarboxylase